MGAWGCGIRQDDTVLDILGEFKDLLKHGDSIEVATSKVLKNSASLILDDNDGPLVWIALAESQWKYGDLDPEILRKVKDDYEAGHGLALWEEDPRELAKRRKAIADFISKIEAPNPKPTKLPKLVVRCAIFEKGDCLSVLLENGQYGAAIVLAKDESFAECGRNLIACLDYLSEKPPSKDVFLRRRWLKPNHHNWDGRIDVSWYGAIRFRAYRDRIAVVCRTRTRWRDPKHSDTYCGWMHLCAQVVHQRAWDVGER